MGDLIPFRLPRDRDPSVAELEAEMAEHWARLRHLAEHHPEQLPGYARPGARLTLE